MKLAAIDIGSNAVRLQIARLNDPGNKEPYKRVEFVRIPVRLGDDAFKRGKISKEKRQVFYKAMEAFALLIQAFDVDHYMACATSALRDAENGPKIVDRVLKDTGLRIDIINGKRESEIILKSIAHLFEPKKSYLTIDVGGGSTEMTVIKNGQAFDSVSFDVGTVRLLDNAIRKKTWKELQDYVEGHLADVQQTEAIATSGTINKIASLISPTDSQSISTKDLDAFHKRFLKMNAEQRIETYKLNPDRADVMEPSAFIYLQILKWANISRISAPSAGLKDGMIYELMERYT
ncbi:MAG: phosphatase [Bacteroidia bacterium]|jgi:exopolyphosphatase/guanosine-5'-triphosphate,3'-diphosphate pyrophosphatase